MRRWSFIQKFCFLNIICALFIIFILNLESKSTSSSSSSQSSVSNPLISHLINSSFRDKLINERLQTHSRMYDNSPRECNVSEPLKKQLEDEFSEISRTLISLRQQIVRYPNEYFRGRGIVLSVGSSQLRYAKVNLKMIELSGTQLPVQVWHSSGQIADKTINELFDKAPKLNLSICSFDTNRCRTRDQTWQLNVNYVYKPDSKVQLPTFPYKPAAIISATFSEVLFLDCDAYVTRDPEELFLFDPMYLKFGALFYADAHKSRQPPSIWKFFNTNCAADEYEIDSATILVDKKRIWDGLYMAKLMNDNHQLFYKHASEGDKDTFRLGFRYMNIKYYIVSIPCVTGSFNGIRFCGRTLCKTDSLAQHIYVNHIHIFKHEGISYTTDNLHYTRVALTDSYNNSFLYDHCRISGAPTSCFQVMQRPNPKVIDGKCYTGEIPPEEIEDRTYMLNQPLLFEKSRDNRAIISKTNNLIPNFIDNFLKHIN